MRPGSLRSSENSLTLDFESVTAGRGKLTPALSQCAAPLAHKSRRLRSSENSLPLDDEKADHLPMQKREKISPST